MLLVYMLCSLCLFNQYINVCQCQQLVAMRMMFAVRLKCIFVLCIVTHDDKVPY